MSPRIRLPGALRAILVVGFAPLVVLGLLVLTVQVYGWLRYDPAYFTERYVQQYGRSATVARALEKALQAGDRQWLAELQGLRWPAALKPSPDLVFVMLWQRTDRYSTYLYFDQGTYERRLYPFEQVRGRWVVAPPDLSYALRSGQWRSTFLRAAVAWWLLAGLGLGVTWLCRRSPRFRGWVLGG